VFKKYSRHVDDVGSLRERGLAVVLIHGWGLGSSVWEKIIPALVLQRDVYTFDLSGYTDNYRSESEDLIPKNYFIVGFSLGGTVATVARDAASPLLKNSKGLITVSTNAKFLAGDDWPSAMQVAMFDKFVEGLDSSSDRVLRNFTALQCKGSLSMREEINYLRAQQLASYKPSVPVLQEGLQLLAESDLRQAWMDLTIPSLHQFGAMDKIVSVDIATQVSKVLNKQVQIFEHSAHQPFLSEPDLWVASINKFAAQELQEAQYV